jgi:hypothetical protein
LIHNAVGKVVVAMRPEDIAISPELVPGAVEFTAYSVCSGADSTIVARLEDTEITVKLWASAKSRWMTKSG